MMTHPFNPDITNTFFRAGEIETWGRGIQRIFAACEAAGSPGPELRYEPNDLWLEFPFSEDYLAALGNRLGKTRVETPVETTQETVMRLMRENPSITQRSLAEKLGLSDGGLKYHIDKMRRAKRIRHVGPTKAGYWEVLK